MMPLLALSAILVMLVAFFLKATLLPYTAFLFLASLVMWGRRVSFVRRRSWGVATLFAGPLALVSLSMVFGETTKPMITALAGTFDECFSGFFFGIVEATEELAARGYAHRVVSVKGYAVLVFILCTLCVWKFLCEITTFENMDLEKVARSRAQPWLGTCLAMLVLVGMLLLFVMELDPYNPSCSRRCSGIQYRNFPFFQMLTFAFSLLYFFVAAFIGLAFGRYASLPASRKNALSAE